MFFREDFRLLIYGPDMINIQAKPVEDSESGELGKLFDYMVRVMQMANGIGLAAPQIGCFKQVAIVTGYHGKIIDLVNPEVTRLYGKETEEMEGCLSLPPTGNECPVPRVDTIDLVAASVGLPHVRKKLTFRGYTARVVQHELDHLTGTFFIDRVSDRRRKEVLERFNNWKAIRRAQIRTREESKNVNAGFVAAHRGSARLS